MIPNDDSATLNVMKTRKAIALFVLVGFLIVVGLHFFSSSDKLNPESRFNGPEKQARPLPSPAVRESADFAVSHSFPSPSAAPPDEEAVRLVQSFQEAVDHADNDTIDRELMEVIKKGAPCIDGLRSALLGERDARAAKQIAYALLRISTQNAYAAILQVVAETNDSGIKNGMIDLLKNGLTKENTGWLIHSALDGEGALRDAAAEVVVGANNPDLLAGLISSATTPADRIAAADVLAHSLSPACAPVLEECAMLPDATLGKAAVSALAGQASEDATRLLLNSFGDYGPAPDSARFEFIVEELRKMLQENADQRGLAITIESLMTTGDSGMTRAAAAAVLSVNPVTDKDGLSQTFQTALQYESDPQARLYLQQGIRRIQLGK